MATKKHTPRGILLKGKWSTLAGNAIEVTGLPLSVAMEMMQFSLTQDQKEKLAKILLASKKV